MSDSENPDEENASKGKKKYPSRNAILAKQKLFQLAPIVAAQQISFEALSEEQLRLLMTCFNHIDSDLRRTKQRARQPWRGGR